MIHNYETIVIMILNCDCSLWIELKLKPNKIEYDTLLWDYSDCDCSKWIEILIAPVKSISILFTICYHTWIDI